MPEDVKARAELLEATRWANDFAWAEIEALAAHLRVEHRRKGEVVCKEGDAQPSLFIIAQGSVSILKQDAGEQPKLLAKLGPGQTIGEMALLDGQPRSALSENQLDLAESTYRALLLVLHRTELDRLVADKPRLGVKLLWKLARFLSQRLRQTSGNLADKLK